MIDLETAKALRLPFLIGVGEKYIEEVNKMLSEEVVYHDLEEYCTKYLNMSKVEYNRAYCAYFHINHMDNYFKVAEDETNLNFFWGDGICREMFMKMNHKNIIELACGRGRHVPKYIDLAQNISLVDILEKNIRICRDRF